MAKSQENPNKLSSRERLFVMYYCGICNFNGTQATIMAGYSKRSARTIACRMLTKDNIRFEIEEEKKRIVNNHSELRDRVMAEYAKIAFSSLPNAAEFSRTLVSLRNGDQLPPEVAHAIKKVTMTDTGCSIELHSKQAALDSMAKVLGMFKDDAAATTANAFEQFVQQYAEERKQKAAQSLINP